jgi:hypothetical protein
MTKEQPAPMPDDKSTLPSSSGDKSVRESGTRPFTVDLSTAEDKDQAPKQPNDRDESTGGKAAADGAPREVMKQAYDDIAQGQVDTDLREQRGVEKTVDTEFKPATSMPEQKHGRT